MISNLNLIQLFQKHVQQNPESVAIIFSKQSITYSELSHRSDQLAGYLINLGVKPKEIVGVYLDRSIEVFVAILAVLKIGAAYVPIDPSYPYDRIQHMLQNSQVSTLLTQDKLSSTLKNQFTNIVCLDRDQSKISQFVNSSIKTSQLEPNSLAYVLYTSGSTGKPKGVMINHNNLVNAYFGWEKRYSLTKQDIHLQMASFSFDVFCGDFIRALCSGAKLVVCPREILLQPAALYSLIKDEQVTCAEFVPTVLRRLIGYLESSKQSLEFMRLLICGSDNWSIGEYKKFKKFCGTKTRLINSYGLTEATIDSTSFELMEGSENNYLDEDSVPIGQPFDRTEIHILDEQLNPVEQGKAGEIYISGPGVASGYLNQPELTHSKFLKFNVGNKDILLYKTGDLAKYLPDGNIQLIGRSDNQKKINGHRIELSDIENNLNQHPLIDGSLVTIQKNKNSHKSLIAYVVFKECTDISSDLLRTFLKQHLPSYMIPSHFIPIESLPLMPNGKLDRNFFVKYPNNFEQIENGPINEVEKKLIDILKATNPETIDDINVKETFCGLGMDSISLTIFANKVSQQFKLNIELNQLLDCPTIKALAKSIERNLSSN